MSLLVKASKAGPSVEPRWVGVGIGMPSTTCGHCGDNSWREFLWVDGRFTRRSGEWCRFDPTQTRRFVDWMTAKGWSEYSNVPDAMPPGHLNPFDVWREVVFEPCDAYWR